MPNYLDIAITSARQAGAIVREGYGQAVHITHKGLIDLVTETDKRSEALILGALRGAFPGHAINSEESGEARLRPSQLVDSMPPRKTSSKHSRRPYRKPTQVDEERILRRLSDPTLRNSAI